MTRRVAFKPNPVPGTPTFGDPVIEIKIEVDQHGLMKTSINKPLPSVQVLGLLLDSMQGQYQVMRQQASLLIDPNGSKLRSNVVNDVVKDNGGQKEEDDNSRGGDTGGSLTP